MQDSIDHKFQNFLFDYYRLPEDIWGRISSSRMFLDALSCDGYHLDVNNGATIINLVLLKKSAVDAYASFQETIRSLPIFKLFQD